MLNLANHYFNDLDELDSTIFIAEEALEISLAHNLLENAAEANYLIGGAHALQANYEVASKILFEAYRQIEKTDNKPVKALIIKEIGYVFLYTGNREKAIEWFNKMYDIFIEIGDRQKAAFTLGSIGTVYYADSNNVEAIKYFNRGLKIAKELKDERVDAFLFSNVALAHFYNGDRKLGEEYMLKSLALNEKMGSRYNIAFDLANLTHFAEMLGKIDKAEQYGLRALPLLKEMNLRNPLRVVLTNLMAVYELKGDYKQAMKYQKEYYELKSEIDAENSKKEAEIQELEYDAEKDQLEIANLNKDIENKRLQQIMLFGGIIVLLGIGLGLWYTNSSLNKKNAVIEEQKDEIEEFNKGLEKKVEERTAELQQAYDEIKEAMTKGQTLERKRIASDLHDNLGSVISAINFSLSGIDKNSLNEAQQGIYEKIVHMTDSAYSDLRNLSHNLLPESLEKEGLVVALEKYAESLNAAQPVWFDFTSNTKERFGKKIELNMYAIVMECCNNILKHAKATEAEISIHQTQEELSISVKDNGKGMTAEEFGKGKGLLSMKERLANINATQELNSSESGTLIKFQIPTT
ncbi:tetratricopeptide repeat protein [Jiulongibacter sp. NS-SX5]|uniref:tetratricopeptide repeat protein n=1 Tax=Jiulongibacter sp. NS-SX5 TaxID=3463854 RepID=UPI00405917F0